MVIYRLIDNSGFDVTVETDASDNQKEFFITDIRGLDSSEVEAGFNIGIQQYNESQLTGFARDKNLGLYSYDKNRRERCLVVPGVNAGRFNGSTSSLALADVPLATAGTYNLPIEISFTYRVTREDLESVFPFTPGGFPPLPKVLMGTNPSDPSTIAFVYGLNPPGPEATYDDLLMFNGMRWNNIGGGDEEGENGLEFDDLNTDTCTKITAKFEEISPTQILFSSYANDELQNSETIDVAIDQAPQNDFDFYWGNVGGIAEFFKGIMRNIKITTSAGVLVDIPDPSTGVNNGSLGDATPTDIESVTVII